MKEIRAYIRAHALDRIILALERVGFTNLTVIEVKAIRHGLEHASLEYCREQAACYTNVKTIELAVGANRVDEVVARICNAARQGRHGDAIVFVSDIEQAELIRGNGHERPGTSVTK